MGKKEILESIIAVGLIVGMIISGMAYFAKAKDLELVDLRLEQKIVVDQAIDVRRQMYQLEDRYGTDDCSSWPNANDRMRYKELKEELQQIKKRQETITEQSKGKL